jgi:hypothetical protein
MKKQVAIVVSVLSVLPFLLWIPKAPSMAWTSSVAQLHRWQETPSNPSPTIHQEPVSKVCKLFNYTRYLRAENYTQFKELGKIALPGDMVELMPGKYPPIYAHEEKVTDKKGKCRWPRTATDGAVYDLHGEPGKLITFCGTPGTTVIDGSELPSSGAGILVIKSSYVRVAGFMFQHLLRGMDIQHTTNSEFLYVTTNHTWHEGIRIRLWSSNNLLQYSNIQHTGKGYVGNGEGVYVGTASGQTVLCGNPKDETNYNIIRDNVFGPNVPSENVDVKEYTTGGQIINNIFDGKRRFY